MRSLRTLSVLVAILPTLLQFAPRSIAAEGRPAFGRERARAAEEITRRATERGTESEERRPDNKRPDPKVTHAEEQFGRIDPTARYSKEPLDIKRLEEAVRGDERRKLEPTNERTDVRDELKRLEEKLQAQKESGPSRSSVERRPNGSTEVIARDGVDVASFGRLNAPDPARNERRPDEAWAAAEFERYWGSKLDRSTDRRIDYVITEGRDEGKKVDFMLTETGQRSELINKNMDVAKFETSLKDHLEKADIVPIDTRFLTDQNKRRVMEVIEKQSAEDKQKIIIIKSE